MAYIFISKNLMTFRHVNFYKKKKLSENTKQTPRYILLKPYQNH